MSMFSQVAELLTRREQKKTEDFDSLVRAVVDGGKKAPTITQIAERLESLGRTAADLEAEVNRRQQRIADAAKLATVPALQKQMADLERQGAAEANRFRPLEAEHRATVRRLTSEAAALQIQIEDAAATENKLLASYAGPLRDEAAANAAEQNQIEQSIRAAEQTAVEHERAADVTGFSNSYPGTTASDTDVASRRTAAKTCGETAAELKKKLRPLIARAAEIQAEMLNP